MTAIIHACEPPEGGEFGAIGWLAVCYLIYISLDLILASTVIFRTGIISGCRKYEYDVIDGNRLKRHTAAVTM